MNSREADRLGADILQRISDGDPAGGCALLAPHLARKTPFRLLDRIGMRIGEGPLSETNTFLADIAISRAMGAWPLIGSALAAQLERDLEGALERCRAFIILGDIWYAADTLAERVPGTALVEDFSQTLSLLKEWRIDPNQWVRKSAGLAVHFWAKRSRGESRLLPRARRLLAFLEPMFLEQDLNAVKGIGWGLKTLGRSYPAAVASWLERQVRRKSGYRALMLRKAVTYLPAAARKQVYAEARR